MRCWDLAATEPSAANRDPDWTVGLKLVWHRPSGTSTSPTSSANARARARSKSSSPPPPSATARPSRSSSSKNPEQPASAAVDRYNRHVLAGFTVKAAPASGDKFTRAIPVAAAAENGLIRLIRARHTDAFLDELTAFPHGKHDDCVDALSGAHAAINTRSCQGGIYIPTGDIDANPTVYYLSRSYGTYLS